VIARLPAQVTESDLLDFFNSKVADFKKIRGGIIFTSSIPRNVVGKLLRRHMRAWADSQS
jgi:acyl-coenzyme A synthetase/AMP-(fatty) acid ligase